MKHTYSHQEDNINKSDKNRSIDNITSFVFILILEMQNVQFFIVIINLVSCMSETWPKIFLSIFLSNFY